MAFTLVTAVPFGGTYLTSSLPATWAYNQTFTVASVAGWREVETDGNQTQVPIGQSGPFVVEIEGEGILCSAVVGLTVYVYQDANTNGRGYTGSAVAHSIGVETKKNLTIVATSAQSNLSVNSATETLSNKRITRRVAEITTNVAAPVYDTDNYDVIVLTGQTTAITSMSSAATGTPNDGDLLQIAIIGSATAITWGANFEASTVALPTVTVLTHRLDNFFVYNLATSKWRIYLSA